MEEKFSRCVTKPSLSPAISFLLLHFLAYRFIIDSHSYENLITCLFLQLFEFQLV